MRKLLFFSVISVLLSLFCSCGSGGCEQTRETFCLAELSSVSGAQINQLYAYGINHPTDSLMLSASNPKSLEFILKPDTTVTDILLQMTVTKDKSQSQLEDTLHVVYDPQPYFLDMECGCSVYFMLKEVSSTNNFLQNVSIKRNEITNEENINIIIEF